VNSSNYVPKLSYCTFLNNTALSIGSANDIAFNSTTMFYTSSNISDCCSSSLFPQITGSSTSITGTMNLCSNSEDLYLSGSCSNIPICLSYSNENIGDDNDCNSSTFYDTIDGECQWYNASNGSNGINQKCGSKKYFECDFYEDSEECISDNIVNVNGGCDWFIINKERKSCENKVISGYCPDYGKGKCFENNEGCDWSDNRGCSYKYFIKKDGGNNELCSGDEPCLTLDHVMINLVNSTSYKESAVYMDSGIYDYGNVGYSSKYYYNVAFTISGFISSLSSPPSSFISTVLINDINSYPIINSINTSSIYPYIFYLYSNCYFSLKYLRLQFSDNSYSGQYFIYSFIYYLFN
jgi:hypothetical protein